MPICNFQKSAPLRNALCKKRLFMAFFFICLAGGAAFLIYGAPIPGILAVAACVFFAFLWYSAERSIKRHKRGVCNCGRLVTYHAGVTYEKRSEWTTTRANSNCSQLVDTTYADVRIHYPCPHCRETKDFMHMICTRQICRTTTGEIIEDRKFSEKQAILDFFEDFQISS